ncbi:MAG: 1-acyl-sn-glycerol-3-phosphate acyltransferase [Treponema sp.]|jgi:1-acyl-sn-glycerol-3-phosphate acyltransferase|nr:1-acyl-sn-glycerol-3-phosphate acyltransferase [Treponema sp.]
MVFAKTAVIFGVTGLSMVLFIPAALLCFALSFFGLKKSMGFVVYKLAQAWAVMLVFLTGCSATVTGRENIPKKGGVCFVSNHVGIFDIILALAYAGRPFGFIAKKELVFVPGVNIWIFLLGGLFIDRRRPRNALKTINLGIGRLRAGSAMLIFPEGTRSRGRGLAPFHPGSLKLASQSGAVIVPLAITGSYDVFEKTRRVRAVPVNVSFLSPVNPAELAPQDRKQLLADRLHDDIARALKTHILPGTGQEKPLREQAVRP